MRVIAIHSSRDRAALFEAPALPRFDARLIEEHAADTHLCAIEGEGEVRAYCSLWWRQALLLADHRAGAIGHYGAVDGGDAASALLREAVACLRANGCDFAIGPMDGNTWRRYRFVTGNGSIQPPEPAFFLEPVNPPEWPAQFVRGGFVPIAEYYSALNSDLARGDERIVPLSERLENAGVAIRCAKRAELGEELKRIYAVSRIAFTRNFLYSELPEEAFLAQYTPMLARIEPELILLAERGPELVGYAFAIPDFAQAIRGAAVDTFIIKTLAVLPDPELRGLGTSLLARAQEAGHRLGYRRAIHALMHENNVSCNISRHYAKTMRQYTLYGMELAP
jgi:GNAT superfamily N-acetyltransferase